MRLTPSRTIAGRSATSESGGPCLASNTLRRQVGPSNHSLINASSMPTHLLPDMRANTWASAIAARGNKYHGRPRKSCNRNNAETSNLGIQRFLDFVRAAIFLVCCLECCEFHKSLSWRNPCRFHPLFCRVRRPLRFPGVHAAWIRLCSDKAYHQIQRRIFLVILLRGHRPHSQAADLRPAARRSESEVREEGPNPAFGGDQQAQCRPWLGSTAPFWCPFC